MLAVHHAAFAGAATVAATEAAVTLHLMAQPGPLELGVIILCGIGAGLFPDIDEPGAAFPRAFGLVGQACATIVRGLCGGHRAATHTVEAIVVTCAIVHFALPHHPLALGIVLGVLVHVALDVLHSDRVVGQLLGQRIWGTAWLGGALMVWGVAHTIAPGDWWPVLAIATGWLSHLVGDSLTPHGVPWTLIDVFRGKNHKQPLFRTGSWAEPLVTWPLVGALLVLAYHLVPTGAFQ